jgi:hypothetical protein
MRTGVSGAEGPVAYCLLPTPYCLLPIAYCLLPTPYCLLPGAPRPDSGTWDCNSLNPSTVVLSDRSAAHGVEGSAVAFLAPYCLLPTGYCLLPTPYSLLPTPYSLLPIAYSLLPIAHCLLPIGYPLLAFLHFGKWGAPF